MVAWPSWNVGSCSSAPRRWSCSAPRSPRPPAGEGRLVFVAGESGVGKTAVVQAFARRRRPRRCGGAPAIRSRRPCRWRRSSTSPRAAGRRCGPSSAPRAPRTTCSRRCEPISPTSRPCSSSRTCTGPTRRRSTSCGSSAGASAPCRCSPSSRIAASAARRDDALRVALGDLAVQRRRRAISLEPLTPDRGAAAGRRPRRRPGRAAPPDRRQPVLRHRGARGGRRRRPGDRPRRRPGARWRGSIPARATCSTSWRRSPQPVEPWLLDAAARTAPTRSPTRRGGRHARRPGRRRGRATGTRSPARRSRTTAAPAPGRDPPRCSSRPGRSARRGRPGPPRPPRRAAPATARRGAPARDRRGRPCGRGRRASRRRPRSTAARCGTPATASAVDRADLLERRAAALLRRRRAGRVDRRPARRDRPAPRGGRRRPRGAGHRLLVPRLTCRGLVDDARRPPSGEPSSCSATRRARSAPARSRQLAHLYLVDRPARRRHRDRRRALSRRRPRVGDERGRRRRRDHGRHRAGLRDGPAATSRARGGARARPGRAVAGRTSRGRSTTSRSPPPYWRDRRAAERWIAEGLAYVDGHDLDLWRLSIVSTRAARSELDTGRWAEATATAAALLGDERDSPGPRAEAARGARRWCAPAAATPRRPARSSDAAALSARSGVDDRGRAAPRPRSPGWTAALGDIGPLTDAAFAHAAAGESPWPLAELALWRHRAGLDVPLDRALPEPVALELAGRQAEAAAALGRARRARTRRPSPSASPTTWRRSRDAHGRLRELGAGGRREDRRAAAARARRPRRRARPAADDAQQRRRC